MDISNDVLINFRANLASDIVISFIFGIVITFFYTKWFNEKERNEQRRQEKILETNKGIELVKIFKTHSSNFYPLLKVWIAKTVGSENYVALIYEDAIPRFDITFWDIYLNSGELPKYFSPGTIERLTPFYGNLVEARKCIDWYYEHIADNLDLYTKSFKAKTFAQLCYENLIFAYEQYPELEKALDLENQKLNENLSLLTK